MLKLLYSFRRATVEDAHGLAALEESFAKGKPYRGMSTAQFKAEIELPNSVSLVVTDDDTDEEVIGYVVYRIGPDFCEIMNIGVKEDFRGLGWGKKLILETIKDSMRQGLKKIFLEVRKSNASAIGLYQASGFDIIRIRKGYYTEKNTSGPRKDDMRHSKQHKERYDEQEDAYEMSLDLTSTGLGLSG